MLKKVSRIAREYITITFGLVMYVMGINQFMLPAEIVGGGVSGIGALFYYATGLPVSYTYLAVNVVLVVVAFIVLGRNFGVKTIYGIVLITFLLKILPIADTPHVSDPLLGAIISGILTGAGIGIAFTQGGSAGGTDIVAMIITKYRNVSVGRVFLYCDLIIIGSSYLLYHSLEKVVYGYIIMGMFSYCIDLVLSGNKQSVQIFIFSCSYEAIANRIVNEQHRGVTILNATGWYTKTDKKLLMILARRNEANNIYRIVKEEDSQAFISVGSIMGVFGQGFDSIKVTKKIDPEALVKKAVKKVTNIIET
ncbi:MAG: YitT family protein [Prevotellaceae bacterium]|jgi:uncharacterized membrane-anchored protein YitT (DUF2179 family)|nr:YitT family protein [Prevotellaceae bacterium]